MRVERTKAIYLVYLLVLAKSVAEEEIKCGKNGPPIRFPFRLRGSESDGYPGFDVFCFENQTVLELPGRPSPPNKYLFVNKIDYQAQEIYLYNPAKCRINEDSSNLSMSISKSPFGLKNEDGYTLFKCPSGHRMLSLLTQECQSEPGYYVTGLPSQYASSDTVLFISFVEMVEAGLPTLAEGKGCKLKNNPGPERHDQTECLDFFIPKNGQSKNFPFVTAGVILGSGLISLAIIAIFYVYTLEKAKKEDRKRIEKFLEDYKAFNPSRYTYGDVKKITNQFKEKLGDGAFGAVFKGKLSNDICVAVKILNNTFKGKGEEFINEVSTMGRIHHVNIVRLVGFCADGPNRALVYDYLPNGSLEKYISSPPGEANWSLNWVTLQEIALGIAKGIEYLHQGCDHRILHFDIKPHNVLLDQDFTPKIADFGMAKLCSKDQSLVSMTTARGTLGYIAPEVFSQNFGNVSYKSDVYSYGILLLEMVGGRKNTTTSTEENRSEHVYYPEWIYNLLEEGDDLRIHVEEEGDTAIAKKLAIVGLWCIQWHPISRPTMKMTIQMLQGDEELAMPPNPFASSGLSETKSKIPSRMLALELETISE